MDNKNFELYNRLKRKFQLPEHEGIFRLMAGGIVNVIEHQLKTNNISRAELAEKLRINESQLCVWLSGEHNFTLKSLARIQAALGTPVILTGNALFNYYRLKEQVASNRSAAALTPSFKGHVSYPQSERNIWLTLDLSSKKKLSNVGGYSNV